jgi:AcrR family transcriptional regulator
MPSKSRKPKTTASNKPYHHGNLSDALLQTAADVISERGVAELRMRDLTRRLGVSHGAPHNHFKDRAELLVALAVQGFERLTEHQRKALEVAHATPAAALNAIGIAYAEFAAANPAHFEVMFQRGLLDHPELVRAALACFQQLLSTVVAIHPKSGGGKRGDSEYVALGAWAMVHGLATLHLQGLLPGGASANLPKITSRVLTAMAEIGLSADPAKPRRV